MRQTIPAVLAAATLVLGGCAGARTRTVDLSYAPSPRPSASGAVSPIRTVAVATFVDARDRTDRIGLRKESAGDTVFVAKGSVPEAVTNAIVKQLAADGYQVTRLATAWDPRSGSAPSADADVVVGGIIEQFYGETDGNYIWSPVETGVRLRVAVASPRQNRVVSQSLIRSDLSGTTTSQSLERNLKERFHAAIAQVPLVQGLEPSLTGSK